MAEVAAQAGRRPSPGRQQQSPRLSPGRQQPSGRLPQPPRRREEFAASSRLAGVGAKIASRAGSGAASGSAASETQSTPRRPQRQRRSPPRRGNISARSNNSSTPSQAEFEEPAPLGGGDTTKQSPRDEAKVKGRHAGDKAVGEERHVDALELAKGGEALLARLSDLNNANSDLRKQLELQVKEVSTLQDAGQSQQQLLREFERQADQARIAETVSIEARVRADIGEREVQLQADLDQANEQFRVEREALTTRLRQRDGEVRHIEGERDEARERIRELEEKLDMAANAPEAQVARSKGLEMELSLVKARFARETEAKKAAERVNAESRAQQYELKVSLEREVAQGKKLQKALAEQTELANFRQENYNDLQIKLTDQKSDAEKKLRREKGKMEAVSRLEGILPRHFLINALA